MRLRRSLQPAAVLRVRVGDGRRPTQQRDDTRRRAVESRRRPHLPDRLRQCAVLPRLLPRAVRRARLPQQRADRRAARDETEADEGVEHGLIIGGRHHADADRRRRRVCRVSNAGIDDTSPVVVPQSEAARVSDDLLLLRTDQRFAHRRQLVHQLHHLLLLQPPLPPDPLRSHVSPQGGATRDDGQERDELSPVPAQPEGHERRDAAVAGITECCVLLQFRFNHKDTNKVTSLSQL